MGRPLCADDFAAIRARIKELRAERLMPAEDEPQPAATRPADTVAERRSAAARPGIPGWRVSRRKRVSGD